MWDMDISSVLVLNLRVAMRRADLLTQKKLAKASGLSQSFLGALLNLETSISVVKLQNLADGLGVEPWQLLLPTPVFANVSRENINNAIFDLLSLSPEERQSIQGIVHSLSLAARTRSET